MTECCISVTGSNVWTLVISVEVQSVVWALSALYLVTCTYTLVPSNTYFNPYSSASAVLYIPLKPWITAFCIVSVTVWVVTVNKRTVTSSRDTVYTAVLSCYRINTFAASYLNTQGLNNSCLKSPASTLADLTFQSRALRSFSLNQLRNLSL